MLDGNDAVIDAKAVGRAGIVEVIDAVQLGEKLIMLAGIVAKPHSDGDDLLARHDDGDHVAEFAGQEFRVGKAGLERGKARVVDGVMTHGARLFRGTGVTSRMGR